MNNSLSSSGKPPDVAPEAKVAATPEGKKETAIEIAPRVESEVPPQPNNEESLGTIGDKLNKLSEKLVKLDKEKPSKTFLTVAIAIISGLFSLGGILLEYNLAAKKELKTKIASAIAEKTATFYSQIQIDLQNVDNLYSEFCVFNTFSRDKDQKLNDGLATINSSISTAPEPVAKDVLSKLRAYDNLLADGLLGSANKVKACAGAKKAHDQCLEAVRKALEDLR